MKVCISYPPLGARKGTPLLSQNRQFQWFKNPTYIYPVVPAYAATMLKDRGFEVVWDDAIAERLSMARWLSRVVEHRPDLIVMETKTPVVRAHWEIIRSVKKRLPNTATVLVGDHVTARPRESMDNCPVDFILTGGDYDFLLTNLCETLRRDQWTGEFTAGAVARLEPGIWLRKNGAVEHTGTFRAGHDLGSLPRIDRDLTRWDLYSVRNGNFKHTPGAYVMAGRDCWWGRCSFCSWTTLYPAGSFRTVPARSHLDEVGHLIDRYGVREIFDDTGCFPVGEWLEEFCTGMIRRGYHSRVNLGCNIRAGSLDSERFALMKRAGFRFVLMGLESASQCTLNRLKKGIRVGDVETTCAAAKWAGLEPHVTIMLGYPWETRQEVGETLALAKSLLRRGLIDSLQATVLIPYPGTALFQEARTEGWLRAGDWIPTT